MNGTSYMLSFLYPVVPLFIAWGFSNMLMDSSSSTVVTERTLVSLGFLVSGIGLSSVLAWKVSRAVARFEVRLNLIERVLREHLGKDIFLDLDNNE